MTGKKIGKVIKKVFLDPYCIATLFFIVWMYFCDEQNLRVQYKLYQQLQKLEVDRIHYTFQIHKIKQEKKAYKNNPKLLEKLAREKYYMKRAHEDLYVIIEQ